MVILQSGLPKSGNYWLYQILQEAMQRAGRPQRSFVRSRPIYEEAKKWPYFADQAGIDYLEVTEAGYFYRKGAFQEKIPDLDGYIASCSHVWTHASWSEHAAVAFRKFDRIVYIIRDPRDAAISASKYFFTPFMREQHPNAEPDEEAFLRHRLYELVLTWIQHVGGCLLHLQEYSIHVVFYERLLQSFDSEFQSLMEYLEINLPPKQVEALKQAVQFSAMKKRSPQHVRKGQAGQWSQVLTAAQKRQVAKMASPLLALLNYPIDESEIGKRLPEIPADLEPGQVRLALQAGRGDLGDKLRYALAFSASRRPLGEKISKGMAFLFGKGRWTSDL
jgi:aryl sulfotransferase